MKLQKLLKTMAIKEDMTPEELFNSYGKVSLYNNLPLSAYNCINGINNPLFFIDNVSFTNDANFLNISHLIALKYYKKNNIILETPTNTQKSLFINAYILWVLLTTDKNVVFYNNYGSMIKSMYQSLMPELQIKDFEDIDSRLFINSAKNIDVDNYCDTLLFVDGEVPEEAMELSKCMHTMIVGTNSQLTGYRAFIKLNFTQMTRRTSECNMSFKQLGLGYEYFESEFINAVNLADITTDDINRLYNNLF